ncbi:MAG: ketoacyl-ACP synthase III [Phycisphaerales bacterium]|nr:ketoacyl-ACP synthase III [Phycisphaerales bacterium]
MAAPARGMAVGVAGAGAAGARGVRIAGTGRHAPEGRLTNADLEKMMDTSDEWIVQRTGIRERRVCDPTKGESTTEICTLALKKALADARMDPKELDLLILGTVTGEMTCPSTACRVAAAVGAGDAGAFDLMAACSGFVYGLNIAHDLIRAGSYRNVAVVGCDVMSKVMDYENRNVAVLFGDAAGAAVLRATDDPGKGMIAGTMRADGSKWQELYLPQAERDFPPGADRTAVKVDALQMNGREVYKFAVGTFSRVIEQTLDRAGVKASDVDMFVCHQSNARMLESARDRFGVPPEKFYINIDRYGNCSAGSVPVCLDELREQGRCREGELVMFVAFGGGLTWAASLWRL